MRSDDPRTNSRSKVATLLAQGKELARQGSSRKAQGHFARALALDADNVEALLWLGAVAGDPKESIHYLNRVLAVSPRNPHALAGLDWARKRLHPAPIPAVLRSPPPTPAPWFDRMLLGSVGLVCIAACVILAVMAWGAPEAVRAAFQATATFTYAPTATLTPTPVPTATPTQIPTATQPPTVTATAAPTQTPPPPTPTATRVVPGEPPPSTALGEKWIQLDLSEQRLTAYEGQTPMLTALVSTGVARMPTPLGEHRIYLKVRSQVMSGPGYSLPNVEWVSYFLKSYAIHGTYWHNNFGTPMSHGCVNLTNADAKWIYEWAPKGTRVVVQQ